MRPYLVKMPKLVKWLFPQRVWALPNTANTVYLTFDDGPIPEVTPWVLEELKKHQAKATFFCIGDNMRKHPEIFKRILDEGHAVGNHTFNHLNGWKTETSEYIENVMKAEAGSREYEVGSTKWEVRSGKHEAGRRESSGDLILDINHSTFLFRPPYGKLTGKQSKLLQKKGYKIIMWDVLSADYDSKVSKKQCLNNVLKHLKPGSIVVFHDSLKAEKNLRYVLPKVLEYINNKNWKCESIE